MVRKRAGVVLIDKYTDLKLNITVEIRLDKASGIFEGKYLDNCFRDTSLETVKRKIREEIRQHHGLIWIPIIKIEARDTEFTQQHILGWLDHQIQDGLDRQDKAKASIDLLFERFHIAKRQDGSWLKTKLWKDNNLLLNSDSFHIWGAGSKDFSIELDSLPLHVKTQYDSGTEVHILAYSEDLWTSLNLIAHKVAELRQRIDQLVSSDDGLKLITAFVSRLLTEGK